MDLMKRYLYIQHLNILLYHEVYFIPFQSCAMVFEPDGNSGEFVDLKAEELNYLGPQDLTQYFIRQTSMNKTMAGAIKVEVVLGRRLLGTVLTVYIPTILLIFIAHTTNYFKSFFFEAVVSVNLTVMLVIMLCYTISLL